MIYIVTMSYFNISEQHFNFQKPKGETTMQYKQHSQLVIDKPMTIKHDSEQ